MGESEPIEFTREDADRLTRIETTQGEFGEKMDQALELMIDHAKKHTLLEIAVDRNTRFRQNFIKTIIWVASSIAGSGLLAAGAKAVGLLG